MKCMKGKIAALTVGLLFGASSAQALTLPPPGANPAAILIDGIPVALKYDDAWSYSAKLLDAVQAQGFLPASYGNYQFTTGTGTLDVILYTGSGTKNRNQNVGPGGLFDFEDPAKAPGGGASTFAGWWGQNDQDNNGVADSVNGPVTVGQVLNYLHAFNPLNNTPIFYLDNNQTGSSASLLFSGRVYLKNTSTNTIVHEWAMDTAPQAGDGTFDPAAMALAAGEVTFTGTSGHIYNVSHNLGSGKPDFIVYVPTMDLSAYDPSLLFITEFRMAGLTDGFEEIFMTGGIGVAPIPEPGTIMLLGGGLIGLGLYGRRKIRK